MTRVPASKVRCEGPTGLAARRPVLLAIVGACLAAVVVAAPGGSPARAADPLPADPTAEPAGPAPLPLARVAREAEATLATLAATLAHLAPTGNEEEIALGIADRQSDIARLHLAFAASRPDTLSPRELEAARIVWQRKAAFLDDWQATLERKTGAAQEALAGVRALEETWRATLVAAGAGGAPEAVHERIVAVHAELEDTEVRIRTRFDELLVLQDRVARLRAPVTGVLAAYDRAAVAVQKALFHAESVPLWRALATGRSQMTVAEEIADSWLALASDVREFLRDNRGRLGLHLVIFAALVLAVRALRGRAVRRLTPGVSAAPILQVFHRPVASAALIALLLTFSIYGRPPMSILQMTGVLLLVPFLRLLPGFVPRGLHVPLYGLAALWAIERFRDVMPHSLSSRLLLLAVGTLGLAGVAVAPWRAKARLRASERWWSATLLACACSGVLLTIAVVSNVAGNVALADLLTAGTLTSAILALLLFAATRVLEAIFSVWLGIQTGQRTGGWRPVLRVASVALWIYGTALAFHAWEPAAAAFAHMLDERLRFGATEVSIGNVVAFLVAIAGSVAAAKFTRLVADSAVLSRLDLPRGVPVAISKTLQYAIVGAGVVLAIGAAGFEMGRFGFLAGALGLGVGFGLQNVVNNFVSGLILLYERPIQKGDVIQTGQVKGIVRRIGPRSSTVRTFDGAEVVVPNANLIAAEVVNWTLSDRASRTELKVGVAYGTDPRRVLEILRVAVAGRPRVLGHPAPLALFTGLGESSLEFEIRFWVEDYEWMLETRSAILAEVYAALDEAGIAIPFPQRDLHLRSVDPAAARALADADSGAGRDRTGTPETPSHG